MRTTSLSPWLVAVVDVALFMLAWLAVLALSGKADSINVAFAFGCLLFPAAVVFWWGFGWPAERSTSKATLVRASIQGLLWGFTFSAFTFLALMVFGSTITSRDLLNLELMLGISGVLLKVFTCFGAGGVATAIGLHVTNSLLARVRPNPSIERTNTGKPVFASHLKR